MIMHSYRYNNFEIHIGVADLNNIFSILCSSNIHLKEMLFSHHCMKVDLKAKVKKVAVNKVKKVAVNKVRKVAVRKVAVRKMAEYSLHFQVF